MDLGGFISLESWVTQPLNDYLPIRLVHSATDTLLFLIRRLHMTLFSTGLGFRSVQTPSHQGFIASLSSSYGNLSKAIWYSVHIAERDLRERST